MGRFKEALEKYLLLEKLDPNFHRYELISVWHFSQLHLYEVSRQILFRRFGCF
jgi:hypothetical protein